MPTTLTIPPCDAGSRPGRRFVWMPLVCGWLLMLATYSPPGRDVQEVPVEHDPAAITKLVLRLCVCGMLGTAVMATWRSPRFREALRVMAPWICFLAWAVLSALWTPLLSVTLGQAFSLGVLMLMAGAVAIGCRDEQDASRVLCGLSVGLLVCSAALLALRLAVPASAALSRDAFGVAHSTNSSAAAALAVLLLVGSRLAGGWRWSRVVLLPGLAVHGVVLVLANNRLSVAGLVPTTLALFLIFGPRGWRSFSMAAVGAAGALYLGFDAGLSLVSDAVAGVAMYAARGQSAQELTMLSGRAEMWQVMWESFLRSPWIGHGYFTCSETGEVYVWYAWGNWTAHNVWLQALVSTGMVGLTLLIAGLVRIYGGVLIAATTGKAPPKIAILLAAVLGWCLVWGFGNESYLGPLQPESVVFFTCVGMGAGLLVTARETAAAGGSRAASVIAPRRGRRLAWEGQ
ncbi:MAG: O-antigen ligase family protein [Planctomycetes bacterium]|nr:O-antigen ligase family protein [Planctomycetota bacterium]